MIAKMQNKIVFHLYRLIIIHLIIRHIIHLTHAMLIFLTLQPYTAVFSCTTTEMVIEFNRVEFSQRLV